MTYMIVILTMCLKLSASQCVYQQHVLDWPASVPFACAYAAQVLAAGWLKTRPEYGLRRAECRPAAKEEIDV